jgi:hypothetical protein
MWNVTTSSWSTDVGFVESERYEILQEAGYASGKTDGKKDSALETLTTAFVSPYWDFKRGHVEFPLSAALFTKNLGQSSSLVGPAIAGGGIAQWQASRTHIFEAKGITNWSKTFSVLRSDKSYAVDSGFQRTNVKPWTIKETKFSLLDRNVLSETSSLDIQLLRESVSGSHEDATLNVSRNSNSVTAALVKKYSNVHKVSYGVFGTSWEKEIFSQRGRNQSGYLAKVALQEVYTPSKTMVAKFGTDFNAVRSIDTLNVFDLSAEVQYLLSHHWKTNLTFTRVNDVFTLEGIHASRTTGSLSSVWRDFSFFELSALMSASRSDVQSVQNSRKALEEFKFEPSGRWFWDHQMSFGARLSWSAIHDSSVQQTSTSRFGIWLSTSWPAVPEKKEL